MKIQTVRDRSKLAVRHEPYWHQLSTGRYVGFRRTEGGGLWNARHYDPATRKQTYKRLKDAGHYPANEQFGAALSLARDWFDHLDKGGERDEITVRQACERYLSQLARDKPESTVSDAESRLNRFVYNEPIAAIPVQKLAKRHLVMWRDKLAGMETSPPIRGKNCRNRKPPAIRQRSASTVNRDMVALRAALNLAKSEGFVTTDLAWSVTLAPIKNADGRRRLYLDRDERRRMLAAIDHPVAQFCSAMCMIPLRPGALAALKVGDFEKSNGALTISKDKSGEGRTILLPREVAALLTEQARNKLPAAPLFVDGAGEAWQKDSWKGPIKRAALIAGLPEGTTAYTLRHSVITDLVTGGLDLFTVAKLSGTSVAMIEKHYGHLQQDHARKALAELAL